MSEVLDKIQKLLTCEELEQLKRNSTHQAVKEFPKYCYNQNELQKFSYERLFYWTIQ